MRIIKALLKTSAWILFMAAVFYKLTTINPFFPSITSEPIPPIKLINDKELKENERFVFNDEGKTLDGPSLKATLESVEGVDTRASRGALVTWTVTAKEDDTRFYLVEERYLKAFDGEEPLQRTILTKDAPKELRDSINRGVKPINKDETKTVRLVYSRKDGQPIKAFNYKHKGF